MSFIIIVIWIYAKSVYLDVCLSLCYLKTSSLSEKNRNVAKGNTCWQERKRPNFYWKERNAHRRNWKHTSGAYVCIFWSLHIRILCPNTPHIPHFLACFVGWLSCTAAACHSYRFFFGRPLLFEILGAKQFRCWTWCFRTIGRTRPWSVSQIEWK